MRSVNYADQIRLLNNDAFDDAFRQRPWLKMHHFFNTPPLPFPSNSHETLKASAGQVLYA
jgi:hypothetical protein